MKRLERGSTIGILGGGQLGMMLAKAARALGYKVIIFCPEQDSCAFRVADGFICAKYDDEEALTRFVGQVDVMTTEFENVPVETIDILARLAAQTEKNPAFYPGREALRVAQDRRLEKEMAEKLKIPTTRWKSITCIDDCAGDIYPAIIKTARNGYDGKGQRRVRNAHEAEVAFKDLGQVPCILEKEVEFKFEFSIIVALSSTTTRMGSSGGQSGLHRKICSPKCSGRLPWKRAWLSQSISESSVSSPMNSLPCLNNKESATVRAHRGCTIVDISLSNAPARASSPSTSLRSPGTP
jgi:formate-dependent phosphoribosylglycinamide formyltransferase (GAR transformylase)